MEQLEARAVAEPQTELAEAARGQSIAVRQADVLVPEPAEDVVHPCAVVGVALEIAPVLDDQALVRRSVDVVDRATDRRQPAGDVRLAQAFRCDRQVGHRRESTEALTEHAPPIDAELRPDRLRVADDRVGAEVGQVLGLGVGCRARELRADRCRPTGPPLIKQDDPVVLERLLHPAGGRARRPGRLEPRPALEEHEVRPIQPVRMGDLSGEDGDARTVGTRVVERDGVLSLGQDRARDAIGGHDTAPHGVRAGQSVAMALFTNRALWQSGRRAASPCSALKNRRSNAPRG